MGVLDDLGMTKNDVREAVRDGTLAPTSPGFGAHSAPVLPPAELSPDARPRRERARRRDRTLAVLGRATAGSTGDVDLPDAAVESERLREVFAVREQVERVIAGAAAAGAPWASGPMADRLRERVDVALYEESISGERAVEESARDAALERVLDERLARAEHLLDVAHRAVEETGGSLQDEAILEMACRAADEASAAYVAAGFRPPERRVEEGAFRAFLRESGDDVDETIAAMAAEGVRA
jgi:hypothetical protein